MKKIIGLSIGYNFVEISAINGSTYSNRAFLSKINLSNFLEQELAQLDLQENDEIIISTKWAGSTLKYDSDSNIALLLTSGFEQWPRLRQPIYNKKFKRNPKRHDALISNDYIFGVTERTSADGTITKKLEIEDLEFLDKKLSLLKINTIAIGFLHSNINSENEMQAAKYFKEKNYTVLCSSEHNNSHNEVARWWRTVLDAYVVESFNIHLNSIVDIFKQNKVKFKIINSQGNLFNTESEQYFNSLFGRDVSLKHANQSYDNILYFGLEDFSWINSLKTLNEFETEFGPVSIEFPDIQKMNIQPTQLISPSKWNIAEFVDEELHYEPGPMLLGRSLKPCFLDLLFFTNRLDLKIFNEISSPLAKGRIKEQLYTFAKDSDYEKYPEELANYLLEIANYKIAHFIHKNIRSKNDILCTGPLAKIIVEQISKLLPNTKFVLDENAEFSESISNTKFKD